MSKKAAYAMIILALLFFFGVVVQLAHCSVPSPRPNSLGLSPEYLNPNAYVFGSIVQGYDNGAVTVIKIQPYNTAMINTPIIVFCGDVGHEFDGKTGVIAITYRRVAHRLVNELACHNLVSVFGVHTDQTGVKP